MAKRDFGVVRKDDDSAVLVANATLTPKGYQQIADVSASTALTVPTGASMALVETDTAAVRWRDDGVAPTASVGMNLAVGALLEYTGDLTAVRFIQVSAGAVLNVSYYG